MYYTPQATLDLRELLEELNELETRHEAFVDAQADYQSLKDNFDAKETHSDEDVEELERVKSLQDDAALYEDELTRLEALQELRSQFGGDVAAQADNQPIMVPDSEWEEYAKDFAVDIGEINKDSSMFDFIDWERYAESLKVNTIDIEFEGITYIVRCY